MPHRYSRRCAASFQARLRAERGGRLAGRYHRPPFTGCGRITPLVNLLVSGPGNAAVIDLIPVPS